MSEHYSIGFFHETADCFISCDLAGMENAKRLLQEIVILPALRPEVCIKLKCVIKQIAYNYDLLH